MFDLVFAAATSLNSSVNPSVSQEPKIASLYCGISSHYGVGDGFHGKPTATGETFNAYGMTAASTDYPLNSWLRVTNQDNGYSVVVRVNDREPYGTGAILDLSYGAFNKIANPSKGRINVCIRRIE